MFSQLCGFLHLLYSCFEAAISFSEDLTGNTGNNKTGESGNPAVKMEIK